MRSAGGGAGSRPYASRAGRRADGRRCAHRRRTSTPARTPPAPYAGRTRCRPASTSRVPGCSSHRRTHSVSSAVAAGAGPSRGTTTSRCRPGRPRTASGRRPRARRRPRRAARGGRRRSPSRRRCAAGGHHLGAGGQPARGAASARQPRTKAASRSRCDRGLLEALGRGERAIRRVSAATRIGRPHPSRRGRPRRARRSRRRTRAPSHGAVQRPISASAQAPRGRVDSRGVHWRSGNASCTRGHRLLGRRARARTARGRWRRRRGPARTSDSRGNGSTVSLTQSARSGNRERRL